MALHFGLGHFATATSIPVTELAQAAEARGFDSLFLTEHSHIPVSRETPFPRGGALPDHYRCTLDPLVALAACAPLTRTLRLGTGILLAAQRDPIITAKAVASLDQLSGGRVVLGVGAGWNKEEMANHGVAFDRRWDLLREKVLAMKAIWAMDEASYQGQQVQFEPLWSWPKPVQPGGPPVWLGANSQWVHARAAEWADGWLPTGNISASQAAASRAACTAIGRDPDSLTRGVFMAQAKQQVLLDNIANGASHLVLPVPSAPAAEVMPLLDRYATLCAAVRAAAG